VFVLFFVGLASIVTGLLMAVGVLPSTMIVAFAAVAVLSGVFAFTLWQPLKGMQGSGIAQSVQGDFVGQTFVLASNVSPFLHSSHRLSGVNWKVRAEEIITAGTMVEVTKVDVGELTVRAK
jgi:inner membrane protein